MLGLYKKLTRRSAPVLHLLLRRRLRLGKEDPKRLGERMGKPSIARPEGRLIWIHAASVGEAQSALILVNALLQQFGQLRILVTSGTVTSAKLMASRLPDRAFHQFYPLDHPDWVRKFLDYWNPDAVYWMESELWPNMLLQIQSRKIPSTLVNGRLSPSSFRRWKRMRKDIQILLGTFSRCLVQTETDASYFSSLGAREVVVTDNLKYSATPLPFDGEELKKLKTASGERPVWLYASTHEGEEAMACRIHEKLCKDFPGLLTVLVPRHPERGKQIYDTCLDLIMNARRRSEANSLPKPDDDIYIADTLGELGLFYRFAGIACIGRSFSKDGGGGHNPIEAAQLGCAIIHGPNVQNLEKIYYEMQEADACIALKTEDDFAATLKKLLRDKTYLKEKQDKALDFAQQLASVIDNVMREIAPRLHTQFADTER